MANDNVDFGDQLLGSLALILENSTADRLLIGYQSDERMSNFLQHIDLLEQAIKVLHNSAHVGDVQVDDSICLALFTALLMLLGTADRELILGRAAIISVGSSVTKSEDASLSKAAARTILSLPPPISLSLELKKAREV